MSRMLKALPSFAALVLFAAAVMEMCAAEAPGEKTPAEEISATGKGPGFAFLCLREAKVPDRDLLKEKLAAWFKLASADDIKEFAEVANGGNTALSFKIAGQAFTISMADVPIPKADIEYACENALLWPEAETELTKQKAHLIVTALGKYETPVENALALSRVVAAASECFDTAGVYWGHGYVVHAPLTFRQEIWEADPAAGRLPVEMWVGYLIAKGKTDGLDLYTAGLGAFGAMEIEVIDSKRKTDAIFDLATNLSTYLMTSGNVVRDGDTVGTQDEEKIPSEYADSAIGRPAKVLRVRY